VNVSISQFIALIIYIERSKSVLRATTGDEFAKVKIDCFFLRIAEIRCNFVITLKVSKVSEVKNAIAV